MRHRHSITENPAQLAGVAALSAAIGAVTALLFTPRSGNQVRRGLKRRAVHIKDELADHLTSTIEEAGDTADDTKERLQATASKVANDTKATATKTRAKATPKPAAKPRRPSS